MSKKNLVILAIAAVILAGIIFYLAKKPPENRIVNIPQFKNDNQPQETSKETISIYAQNLEVVWALAFLPGGDLLATERKGTVNLIDKEGNVSRIFTLGNVLQTGESGLHGIAIHPDFENNQFVYLYYTYKGGGDNTQNRVSRFRFDGKTFTDEKIIVDAIPGAIFHDGGRIKFGPDKNLYITTGDALNPSLAQDVNSSAGKILRVDDEGNPAPDNPFGTRVWSYGHRNPQGIAWDSEGRLWETEHGQSQTDEFNLIEPGKNYGWPTIRGDQKAEGLKTPILHSGNDTWAPAGAAFFDGSIFFGGLRGQALYQAKLQDNSAVLSVHFKKQFGRIRDVIVGPDGFLYIATSNRDGRGKPQDSDDKIIRIDPNQF
ncbi:MAG TPA: PQQ-dependent sugar dehydrogenase [Patescibacteria group bacterium]|nr:PQQ-dependent sugar dehydrogenase [Patescibacteria group bacterium]